MKLKLIASSLLVFLLFGTSATAQKITKKVVNAKITRSWTAVEVGRTMEDLMPKNSIEVIIFDGEGAFAMEQESKMVGLMKMAGEWEYDKKENKLMLTMISEEGNETVGLGILELTDNRLVLEGGGRVVAYIPSENVPVIMEPMPVEPAAVAIVAVALNPETWTGSLAYNVILLMDNSDEETEVVEQGTITLSAEGENKILTKTEGDNTIIWTVTSEMMMGGINRYSVDCTDAKYIGELTFQNKIIMIEVYEPEYMSYIFAKK